MKRICLAILLFCISNNSVFADVSEVAGLEKLVRQWVELKGAREKAQREWQEEKAVLQRELDLLQAEKARLEADLSEWKAAAEEDTQVRLKQEVERDTYLNAHRSLEPALEETERRLRAMMSSLPPFLAREMGGEFSALPTDNAQADQREILTRLQAVLGALNLWNELTHEIHVGVERVSLGDEKREMNVLYLGLSRGFALSNDGKTAAIGVWESDQWVFRRAEDDGVLASELRKAFDVLAGQQTAETVVLPLELPARNPAEENQ